MLYVSVNRRLMRSRAEPTLSLVYKLCKGSWYNLARPRSPILTCPFSLTRMFAGFKSRCMIQLSCKYETPLKSCQRRDLRTPSGRCVLVVE